MIVSVYDLNCEEVKKLKNVQSITVHSSNYKDYYRIHLFNTSHEADVFCDKAFYFLEVM